MIGGMSSAATAMRAYSTVLNVTGNNIANINSRDYSSKSVTLAEQGSGGVSVTSVRDITSPAPHIQSYFNSSEAFLAHRMSNVDIGHERLNEIVSLRSTQANTATMNTVDDLLGTVINMKV